MTPDNSARARLLHAQFREQDIASALARAEQALARVADDCERERQAIRDRLAALGDAYEVDWSAVVGKVTHKAKTRIPTVLEWPRRYGEPGKVSWRDEWFTVDDARILDSSLVPAEVAKAMRDLLREGLRIDTGFRERVAASEVARLRGRLAEARADGWRAA